MKKSIFSVMLLFCCSALFFGCTKNTSYVTTINPYMTASIGTYNFTAATIVPSTVDTQLHDTTTTLYITGNSADEHYPGDKMVLTITKYKGLTGIFSIVQGQANAWYIHEGIPDFALGGIVAVTKVTSNTIVGYFSFNTASGLSVSNGLFTVGKP